MSGFEIAGVVLGSIPLIISAIEHYESNLDRVKAFWKWKDELEKAIRELWIQHSSYEMTLRNLLKDIASPVEINEMMQDFRHVLWSSSVLREALEQRLQTAYRVYVHTIKEMESYMIKLASSLDIDRQTGTSNELEAIVLANRPIRASSHQAPPQFEFRRRIKLTLKRKEIKTLLQSIKSCNERLDQFISKAEKLEQPRIHAISRKSSLIMSLQQIQDYTISLDQALSRAWSCSKSSPHSVYLRLEHRMVRREQECSLRPVVSRPASPSFTMLLKSPLSKSGQHVIEVQISEEEMKTSMRVESPAAASHTSQSIGQTASSNMKLVENLCAFYCGKPNPVQTLGFNLDSKGRLYGTYQPSCQPVCPFERLVNLEDLLSKPANKSKRRSLSDEDRYLLAITLASSMLQLHTTPWLRGCWSKRDILFSDSAEGDTSIIDVHHPVILNTYGCVASECGNQIATGRSHIASNLMRDSASLLTLAKVLLELKLNDRFDTHQKEKGLGTDSEPNEATDVQTLLRWMAEEKGNLSFTYRDVVSRCIKCSVDPNTNLCDLRFRQKLVDGVVVPLLEELHCWQGGF